MKNRFKVISVSNNWNHLTVQNCSLRAVLNKSWRQHPTKHQLHGHLLPISQTITVRRTRTLLKKQGRAHKGCSPMDPRAKAGRPARTYIQQLCEDTRCSPEDLPKAMNDKEGQGYPCWRQDKMMMKEDDLTVETIPILFCKQIISNSFQN